MKAKTTIGTVLTLLLLCIPGPGRAEVTARLGAEAPVVVPASDWADVAGIGFGGLIRFELNFTPSIAVNVRLGYVHHLTQTLRGRDISLYEIPVLVGFKYIADFGLYGELALGLVKNGGSVEGYLVGASDTEAGLMMGLGYQRNGFSAGAYLYSADAEDIDNVIGILVNVGYTFHLF
jgi:hypothetical protein